MALTFEVGSVGWAGTQSRPRRLRGRSPPASSCHRWCCSPGGDRVRAQFGKGPWPTPGTQPPS